MLKIISKILVFVLVTLFAWIIIAQVFVVASFMLRFKLDRDISDWKDQCQAQKVITRSIDKCDDNQTSAGKTLNVVVSTNFMLGVPLLISLAISTGLTRIVFRKFGGK